jgi:hypothetical protein
MSFSGGMMTMRSAILTGLLAGAGLFAAVGTASAMNCYTVIDKNDNVVYRGNLPPIDLSEQGNAEREAMRKRGQHLIAMEVDRCIGVEYFTGTAGSTTLSVDQIVGGIQMRGVSPGGYAGPSPSSAASRAPIAPAAPQSPPKP